MKEEHTSDKGGKKKKKNQDTFLNGTFFFLSKKCFSKSNSVGYLHWMAPATVICDSSSIASSQLAPTHYPLSSPPNGHPAFPPKSPLLHLTHIHEQEGGSMRRVQEHTREQGREREQCVGVIYLLSRLGSQVW